MFSCHSDLKTSGSPEMTFDLRLWFCRFGRKPVLFGAVALQGFSGLAQIFSSSWTVFVVLFFITGVGRVSSYVSGFILGRCTSSTDNSLSVYSSIYLSDAAFFAFFLFVCLFVSSLKKKVLSS